MRDYSDIRRKRDAVKQAEERGVVADSMEVRMKLLGRFKAGEITCEEMQAALKKIKRDAKKNGLVTQDKIYREG